MAAPRRSTPNPARPSCRPRGSWSTIPCAPVPVISGAPLPLGRTLWFRTTSAQFQGRDDPLLAAATRVIDSIRAVLSGYGIRPDELDHAIRMLRCTIHGYALLQAANASQWGNAPDESVAWMIGFVDAGMTAVGDNAP
ncbi:MAG TPA: TetR-like C-terminal domain-containing protein [Acidimicrobiales bacterium]|nr:TetR-like C-terminal domain-containing protein [Acidimicrobiales bacterium]